MLRVVYIFTMPPRINLGAIPCPYSDDLSAVGLDNSPVDQRLTNFIDQPGKPIWSMPAEIRRNSGQRKAPTGRPPRRKAVESQGLNGLVVLVRKGGFEPKGGPCRINR